MPLGIYGSVEFQFEGWDNPRGVLDLLSRSYNFPLGPEFPLGHIALYKAASKSINRPVTAASPGGIS
jgi:hypothetical protein